MNKGKITLIATISVVTLLLVAFITALPVWGDSKPRQGSGIPTLEQDREFSVEDMTSLMNDNTIEEEDIIVSESWDITKKLKQRLKSRDSMFSENGRSDTGLKVYETENDPKILEIQRQITLLEQKRKENQSATRQQPSPPIVKQKTKKELERDRMVRELEEYRQYLEDQKTEDSRSNYTKPYTRIRVRASIYNDHRIFPGDRVTLLLDEDMEYNGKLFTEGTFIYGLASFSKNRVHLDIGNIQHEPIALEAIDVQDGRSGMYVAQVAEFQQKYTELEGDVIGDGASEIGTTVSQRFAGRLITGVGNLLKNKRLKQKDRVYLINDHQVYLIHKPSNK